MLTSLDSFTLADKDALAWLCDMAAVGCLHEGRSAWGAQLRDEARRIRREIQQQDAGR